MMQNEYSYNRVFSNLGMSRKTAVGIILIVALIAFETFNFDTTQYALRNLLGDVRFLGLQWASILAIAFCSIDFAGLIRIFTPQRGADEPREVSFLMGAWLLGATMNAIMTWWAISLTLMNHTVGNQVLSSEQLLLYVPIFVAVLVWLTRILFIGAFTVAGEHIFDFAGVEEQAASQARLPKKKTQRKRIPAGSSVSRRTTRAPMRAAPKPSAARSAAPVQEAPTEIFEPEPAPRRQPIRPAAQQSRVRQRPPRPGGNNMRRMPVGMQAKGRDRH